MPKNSIRLNTSLLKALLNNVKEKGGRPPRFIFVFTP